MPHGGKGGGYRNMGYSTDRTFANAAIKVFICRGCGAWHERTRPITCTCGRMDFDDFPAAARPRHG